MAYLGNKPVNNFVSFAKQNITGDGGTSYSLDYPVTGANDIELFINNVRQEPTEAYSCSGSTLTLTEAVSSSDDVYVIFRGRALQTAQHPSDSALEAASGTFSGVVDMGDQVVLSGNTKGISTNRDDTTISITSNANQSSQGVGTVYFGKNNGSSFDGDIHHIVDSTGTSGKHRFWTWNGSGWTNTVNITSEGYHLTPKQPFAFVGYSGTQSYINHPGGPLQFNTVFQNQGNHYNTSTYKFTCPVDGVYLVTGVVITQNDGDKDGMVLRKNGTIVSRSYTNYRGVKGTFVVKCAANDTLELWIGGSGLNIYQGNGTETYSSGSYYLLG